MTKPTNKYPRKLRDGTACRVLATDGAKPKLPIIIELENSHVGTRAKDGRFHIEESSNDLMPETKTETVKFWVAHPGGSDDGDITYFEGMAARWRAWGRKVSGPHTAEIEV